VKYSIRIFDADATVVDELKQALRNVDSIIAEQVDARSHWSPPGGIDVLYLPLAAAEPFGSRPVWHESLILPTTPEYQARGMPRFVVTGTGLLPNDPRGPAPEMRMLLSCIFEALRQFNERETVKLATVGFWARDLLEYRLRPGLSAIELREILLEVVPGLR